MSKAHEIRSIKNPDYNLESVRLTAILDTVRALDQRFALELQDDEIRELGQKLGVPYLALFLADSSMVTIEDIDEWHQNSQAEEVTRWWIKRSRP